MFDLLRPKNLPALNMSQELPLELCLAQEDDGAACDATPGAPLEEEETSLLPHIAGDGDDEQEEETEAPLRRSRKSKRSRQGGGATRRRTAAPVAEPATESATGDDDKMSIKPVEQLADLDAGQLCRIHINLVPNNDLVSRCVFTPNGAREDRSAIELSLDEHVQLSNAKVTKGGIKHRCNGSIFYEQKNLSVERHIYGFERVTTNSSGRVRKHETFYGVPRTTVLRMRTFLFFETMTEDTLFSLLAVSAFHHRPCEQMFLKLTDPDPKINPNVIEADATKSLSEELFKIFKTNIDIITARYDALKTTHGVLSTLPPNLQKKYSLAQDKENRRPAAGHVRRPLVSRASASASASKPAAGQLCRTMSVSASGGNLRGRVTCPPPPSAAGRRPLATAATSTSSNSSTSSSSSTRAGLPGTSSASASPSSKRTPVTAAAAGTAAAAAAPLAGASASAPAPAPAAARAAAAAVARSKWPSDKLAICPQDAVFSTQPFPRGDLFPEPPKESLTVAPTDDLTKTRPHVYTVYEDVPLPFHGKTESQIAQMLECFAKIVKQACHELTFRRTVDKSGEPTDFTASPFIPYFLDKGCNHSMTAQMCFMIGYMASFAGKPKELLAFFESLIAGQAARRAQDPERTEIYAQYATLARLSPAHLSAAQKWVKAFVECYDHDKQTAMLADRQKQEQEPEQEPEQEQKPDPLRAKLEAAKATVEATLDAELDAPSRECKRREALLQRVSASTSAAARSPASRSNKRQRSGEKAAAAAGKRGGADDEAEEVDEKEIERMERASEKAGAEEERYLRKHGLSYKLTVADEQLPKGGVGEYKNEDGGNFVASEDEPIATTGADLIDELDEKAELAETRAKRDKLRERVQHLQAVAGQVAPSKRPAHLETLSKEQQKLRTLDDEVAQLEQNTPQGRKRRRVEEEADTTDQTQKAEPMDTAEHVTPTPPPQQTACAVAVAVAVAPLSAISNPSVPSAPSNAPNAPSAADVSTTAAVSSAPSSPSASSSSSSAAASSTSTVASIGTLAALLSDPAPLVNRASEDSFSLGLIDF